MGNHITLCFTSILLNCTVSAFYLTASLQRAKREVTVLRQSSFLFYPRSGEQGNFNQSSCKKKNIRNKEEYCTVKKDSFHQFIIILSMDVPSVILQQK